MTMKAAQGTYPDIWYYEIVVTVNGAEFVYSGVPITNVPLGSTVGVRLKLCVCEPEGTCDLTEGKPVAVVTVYDPEGLLAMLIQDACAETILQGECCYIEGAIGPSLLQKTGEYVLVIHSVSDVLTHETYGGVPPFVLFSIPTPTTDMMGMMSAMMPLIMMAMVMGTMGDMGGEGMGIGG